MSAIASTVSSDPSVGFMTMPENFPYRDILLHGRPRHEKFSRFRIRHPEMPCSRRAKLFAPFDALKGFDERVANKEVEYVSRRHLSDGEREELDRKLSLLQRLTRNKKAAQRNAPVVTAAWFSPCTDRENAAFGTGGRYVETTGIVSGVDPVISRTITIDGSDLPLNDITDLKGSLFDDPIYSI